MTLELLKSKTEDLTGFIVTSACHTSVFGAKQDHSWFYGNLSGLTLSRIRIWEGLGDEPGVGRTSNQEKI